MNEVERKELSIISVKDQTAIRDRLAVGGNGQVVTTANISGRKAKCMTTNLYLHDKSTIM